MTPSLAAGLGLALVSSTAINIGFFVQHRALHSTEPLSILRPLRFLTTLSRNPAWVAGTAAGFAGWGLYVWALVLAPLSLVQAVSAGGIGVLALAVSRFGNVRLTARETAGVAAAIAGLSLLGMSLGRVAAAGHANATEPVAWWILASAMTSAVVVFAPHRASGARLGIAAGTLYAAGDIATKAALAGHLWLWPPLLACHGAAFLALQTGFQRGGALATAGTASLLLNALPIAAGITMFHDTFPSGMLAGVRLASFAFVVAGALLLARGGAGATT